MHSSSAPRNGLQRPVLRASLPLRAWMHYNPAPHVWSWTPRVHSSLTSLPEQVPRRQRDVWHWYGNRHVVGGWRFFQMDSTYVHHYVVFLPFKSYIPSFIWFEKNTCSRKKPLVLSGLRLVYSLWSLMEKTSQIWEEWGQGFTIISSRPSFFH